MRKPNGFYTKQMVMEAGLKYKTPSEWEKCDEGSYRAASRLGILAEATAHMERICKNRTNEEIINESKKYKTQAEWRKVDPKTFQLAYKRGLIRKEINHLTYLRRHITKDLVLEISKKYKTKKEWHSADPKSYAAAQRRGIMKQATAHMTAIYKTWPKESVMRESSKYQTINEWINTDNKSYDAAARHGWLDEATAHMKRSGGISLAEKEVLDWVKQYYPSAKTKRIENIRTDVYISELKLAIEYNGIYWHNENNLSLKLFDKPYSTLESKETAIVHKHHLIRTALLKNQAIELVHIWEHEWLTRQDQVKNFLYSKLKLSKTVGARKCEFKILDKREARAFCERNHIQGDPKFVTYALGAYYNNELIMVCTFSKHHRTGKEIVLNRMCCKHGLHVAGGLSKMSKLALEYFKQPIKTWAHRTLSDGSGYIKSGWKITKVSNPDYFYQKQHKVFSKQAMKKSNIKKKYPDVYSPDKTEYQMATELGFCRVWDCGKITLMYGLK